MPAFKVQVLRPAPSPFPAPSNPTSHLNTPAASTPHFEPMLTTPTPSEVASKLCWPCSRKIEGVVITVPSQWSAEQRATLETAAKDAGIPVIQLEAAVATSTTTFASWVGDDATSPLLSDLTQVIIDVGSTSTSLSHLSIHKGLSYVLASMTCSSNISQPISPKRPKCRCCTSICRLGSGPCDWLSNIPSGRSAPAREPPETLIDGYDYTGSINRMQFDMVSDFSPVYASVADPVTALPSSAGVDSHEV